MDVGLRNYIRQVLNEARENRLDELEGALTRENISEEAVSMFVKRYRECLRAIIAFGDWEDGDGAKPVSTDEARG